MSVRQDFEEFRAEENPYSNIDHVIAVVSGKGGVGKSLVTAALANEVVAEGLTAGILDADITGPSIPKMYGLHGRAGSDENGIYPYETRNGLKVMSTNLLLEQEDQPVIWRGPVIGNMVKQFWSDVIWGQLDYLFIDMPPGTGDVPLTVFQSLPVDGIILVTSPQDLVSLIVKKALHMAEMMDVPVIGLIENFHSYICPHCGEELFPFGESHIEAVSAEYGLPVLAALPVDTSLAGSADEGTFDGQRIEALAEALKAIRGKA